MSNIFVRYKHEISLVKDAKPNQEVDFVRCCREFVITVIVITEFDCNSFLLGHISHAFDRGTQLKSNRGP